MNDSDRSQSIADVVRSDIEKEAAVKRECARRVGSNRKVSSSRQILEDNLRAIVIHFGLSTVGMFIIFFIVQTILFAVIGLLSIDEPYWFGYVFLSALFTGSVLAYIACGYKFLKPVEGKTFLSVIGLACIAGFVGIVFAVAHVVGIPLFEGPEVIGEMLFALMISLNSVGFLAVSFFLEQGIAAVNAIAFLFIVATSLLSPFLLYLGLRLRIWRREDKQEIVEGGRP